MGIDFQSLLYEPIYTLQGVTVLLTLGNGAEYDSLTALDKTTGVEVGDHAEVPTIQPAAAFRIKELIDRGLILEDLLGATLEMNEWLWTVRNYKLKPSPNGQDDGEVFLILDERRKVTP